MHLLASKRPFTEKFFSSIVPHQKPNSSSISARTRREQNVIPVRSENVSGGVDFIRANHSPKVELISSRAQLRKGYLRFGRGRDHKNPFSERVNGVEHCTWRRYRAVKVLCQADKTPQGFDYRKDGYDETAQGFGHRKYGYDAILVLAGGQLIGGGVPLWVEKRLDKALELQKRFGANGGALCKIVCLGGGTPHKAPILSAQGFVVHESASCADYLVRQGVPFTQLIKEWGSYDTIGNGYFSLTQHAIPRRWRALAVVTSDFHMPRTEAVFRWIFGLRGAGVALRQQQEREATAPCTSGCYISAGGAAAAMGPEAEGFRLSFHGVSDESVQHDVLEARAKREHRSLQNLSKLVQRIRTLEDFHEWFHTEHKAYNTENQHDFGQEPELDDAFRSY